LALHSKATTNPEAIARLSCEVGDAHVNGHPRGGSIPRSDERLMRPRDRAVDPVSTRRWRTRLVLLLATVQRRWFSWPPPPVTRPRHLMVVLGRRQETLGYSRSGLPHPRGDVEPACLNLLIRASGLVKKTAARPTSATMIAAKPANETRFVAGGNDPKIARRSLGSHEIPTKQDSACQEGSPWHVG
jgi:hypothetical protein